MTKQEIRKESYVLCLEIEKALNNGQSPEEIAEIFGSKHYYEEVNGDDIDFHVDFEHFGITFYGKVSKANEWIWSGGDDVWMYDTEDWENWNLWEV